jgi:amphi-Trp domain-containing protein
MSMAAPEEFDHESLQDQDSAARFLHSLAQGIAAGDLTLGSDSHNIALVPEGLIRFRLSVRRSKARTRLVVKLSWRESRERGQVGSSPLRISRGQAQD